jgi:hypothetical protein
MIVTIGRHYVEHNAPEGFLQRWIPQLKPVNGQEPLADIVRGPLPIVEVCQAAQRLQVMLRVFVPVEPFRHEMRAAALFQQSAGRHRDSCCARHQMVRMLDPAVILTDAQTFVRTDAVKLDQPVFEARPNVELSGSDLLRAAIPGNDGQPCPAGGGAHLDDLGESSSACVGVDLASSARLR